MKSLCVCSCVLVMAFLVWFSTSKSESTGNGITFKQDNQALFSIDKHGNVFLPSGITPNAASMIFWQAVAANAKPLCNE